MLPTCSCAGDLPCRTRVIACSGQPSQLAGEALHHKSQAHARQVRSEVLACEHHHRFGQSDLILDTMADEKVQQLRGIMNPFKPWSGN
jgi:hypothetical protein